MKIYTAQQVADLLKEEEQSMTLRKVRYYTQLGLIPPLELVESKRVYTDKHILYFRAVLTLAKTGTSLASIKEQLQQLSLDEVEKISNQLPFYTASQVLQHQTHKINEDISVTISPNVSGELKQHVLNSLSQMVRGKYL